MAFWYGLLSGFAIGAGLGLMWCVLLRRKLAMARQAYKIAERVANAMEYKSKRQEEALKLTLTQYARCHQEEERLRSEKLKAWGIPEGL